MPKQRRRKSPRESVAEVEHPRYGCQSIPSGFHFTAEEVSSGFWQYPSEDIFPESAIPADISRQRFVAMPRRFYVDIRKGCCVCGRSFIFFAQEQKYWYETLGFYIDADCALCPECRRSDQQLRRRFKRYSDAVVREDLDDREVVTLIRDAVFLYESGILRHPERLRQLRRRALERIPGSSAAEAISEIVAELKK